MLVFTPRLFTTLLPVLFCFALAACSGSGQQNQGAGNPEKPQKPEAETPSVSAGDFTPGWVASQVFSILEQESEVYGQTAVFRNVTFEEGIIAFNQANYEAVNEIDELAKLMLARPGIDIELQVYTDDQASPEANRELGKERADVIKAELFNQGVDFQRIDSKGFDLAASPEIDSQQVIVKLLKK